MWQAWTIGFLGLWYILTAFFSLGPFDRLVTVFGISLVAGFAGWQLQERRRLQGWCTIVLALWMVAGESVPAFAEGMARQWNVALSGVLLAIAGFSALGGERHSRQSTKTAIG